MAWFPDESQPPEHRKSRRRGRQKPFGLPPPRQKTGPRVVAPTTPPWVSSLDEDPRTASAVLILLGNPQAQPSAIHFGIRRNPQPARRHPRWALLPLGAAKHFHARTPPCLTSNPPLALRTSSITAHSPSSAKATPAVLGPSVHPVPHRLFVLTARKMTRATYCEPPSRSTLEGGKPRIWRESLR